MDILEQIQNDLLNESLATTNVLRKAKVLSYQLNSTELSEWITNELSGYKSVDNLPDYRILNTTCIGTWTNGYWQMTNQGVPFHKIDDEELKKFLTTYMVFDGLKTVEQLANSDDLHFQVPNSLIRWVNNFVSEGGYSFLTLNYAINLHHFSQILDTVKNRLLDFVLELSEKWSIKDSPPSGDTLSKMFNIIIFNPNQGGNVMTVFDQRGQNVKYQYNAGGDINFSNINSRADLTAELGKLKIELKKAIEGKAIDDETGTDVEYKLTKAIQESQKPNADKKKILENINYAKELLSGISASVGLVTAFVNAAELVQKLF